VAILREIKNYDPSFTAIFFIGATLFIHVLLILKIIQKISGILILHQLPSKYYMLIVAVPLFVILFAYYSKSRKEFLLKEFEKRTAEKKMLWQVVSVIGFFAPIILILAL
jgi:hypothetical protein